MKKEYVKPDVRAIALLDTLLWAAGSQRNPTITRARRNSLSFDEQEEELPRWRYESYQAYEEYLEYNPQLWD